MMSNVDPRFLRTCQPVRAADEDAFLLRRELGRSELASAGETEDDEKEARTGKRSMYDEPDDMKEAGDGTGGPTAVRWARH